MNFTIREDDLKSPEVLALLGQHLALMASRSPPLSIHALDPEALNAPEVTVWTVWSEGTVVGCGALKELVRSHGEIKSMHTVATLRGQGVGTAILRLILAEAQRRGYCRLSLETGSMLDFAPARSLYTRHGFSYCAPFGNYAEDPNSVFMTRLVR